MYSMSSKMYWRLPKHSFSKFWTALYEAILSECCYSTSRITSCALFDQLLRSTRLFVFSWRVTGWVCVGSQLTALLYWLFFDIWNIFLQWIFGIFDGDFELIVMESTQFSDEIRRRRRHRHWMTMSGVPEWLCWLLTAQRSHLWTSFEVGGRN